MKLGKKKEKRDEPIKELEVPKQDLSEKDESVFELPQFSEVKKLKEKESQIDERYIEIEGEIRDVHKKTETLLKELDDMSEDITDTVARLKNIFIGIKKRRENLVKSLAFEED